MLLCLHVLCFNIPFNYTFLLSTLLFHTLFTLFKLIPVPLFPHPQYPSCLNLFAQVLICLLLFHLYFTTYHALMGLSPLTQTSLLISDNIGAIDYPSISRRLYLSLEYVRALLQMSLS